MGMLDLYNDLIITKKDLAKLYEAGCKPPSEFKIGIEYERLLIDKKNYRAVSYYGENGIYRLLRQIAYKDEWSYITDFGQVVGLRKGNTTITLEPGGQFEISLEPQKSIQNIENEIEKLDKKIKPITRDLGISLINSGISPLATYKDISFIPKKRYEIMSQMLPGDLLQNMMKETASIQVSLDYESEEDAINKLKLALKLSPVMSGMFANSPMYSGYDSDYKSYRALSWLFTDNTRCGLISRKLFDHDSDFSFIDYVNVLSNIPMLYIVRNNQVIEIKQKINFDKFIKEGYENYIATMDDFKLHANLYFPEVRLNNYIEIRNHDCQKGALKYAIPAVYKGLFYNKRSVREALLLFKKFSYEDFVYARENVPRCALNAKLGEYRIGDIAKEVLNIAHTYLYKEGKSEQKYLEPIRTLVDKGMCPADVVIKNWYEKWNCNFSKFVQYSIE